MDAPYPPPPTPTDEALKTIQKLQKQTMKKALNKVTEEQISNEKKLQDRLDNSLFGDTSEESQSPQIKPEFQVIQSEEDSIQDEEKELDREILKSEITQEVHSKLLVEDQKPLRYYMTGTVGTANYSRVINVQSKMGTGFSVGADINERLAFEAMFFYSRHLIDEGYWRDSLDVYQEMDQYNIGILGKYKIVNGFVSPYVGGIGNITRRDYSEIGVNHGDKLGIEDLNNTTSSTAFDMGVSLGFEVELTQNFLVGCEWRFMRNLYQETEFDFGQLGYEDGTPIEEINYRILSISLKAVF